MMSYELLDELLLIKTILQAQLRLVVMWLTYVISLGSDLVLPQSGIIIDTLSPPTPRPIASIYWFVH